MLGIVALVGAILGAVVGGATSVLTYPQVTAIIQIQIGSVPASSGPVSLLNIGTYRAPPKIELVADPRKTMLLITSPAFIERIATTLKHPELVNLLNTRQNGGRGHLSVRAIPTMEGGRLEVVVQAPERKLGLDVVQTIVRELTDEHRPIFMRASQPYWAYLSTLRTEVATRTTLLNDIEASAAAEADPASKALLLVGQNVAEDASMKAAQALEGYIGRVNTANIHNTARASEPILRRPILSVTAAAALLGALGGMAVGILVGAAILQRRARA